MCSMCKTTLRYVGQWTEQLEQAAVVVGWRFWDKSGPVEQLGRVFCPAHNPARPSPPETDEGSR